MFNPDGCFCCEPPEDPCVLSGCTWSSTEMSDADLTAGVTYHNPASGSTPDGTYEVTNVQDATTGNNAPCRKITIETVVAPAKAESVYAICWKDGATHNPATQCPLTNVSFCVESKRYADSDGGLTDGVVFVVRQGGKIYATATQAVGVNWKRASGTYTSTSFTWVNGTGNPNFTATGSAIEFGFALKLSVPKDGTPYDVVLFDNLCVKRTVDCGGGGGGCGGGWCGCNSLQHITVALSGVSVVDEGCAVSNAVSSLNTILSSTIVLTKNDRGNFNCSWTYSTPVTSGSNNGNFGRWWFTIGCSFDTGTGMLLVALRISATNGIGCSGEIDIFFKDLYPSFCQSICDGVGTGTVPQYQSSENSPVCLCIHDSGSSSATATVSFP